MMHYKDLTEEQRAKLAAAHTPEDVFRIAKEEGRELSEEEMQQIAGGWKSNWPCPKCGGQGELIENQLNKCTVCGHIYNT